MAHEPPVNTAEDRFGWMIRRQREFQEDILGYGSLNGMTPDQRAEYFRVQSLALVFELGEASNEIGWKPWATSKHFNPEAYLSEAIDIMHFAVNLALAGGATTEQIFQMFVTKNEKNRARQRDGYDGVTGKCPACSRSYDDAGVRCTPVHSHPEEGAGAAWCDVNRKEL